MPTIPPRNFDTASERWGAWAEGMLVELQRTVERLTQNEGNANKSVSATLGSLAETVLALGQQVVELEKRKTIMVSAEEFDETRAVNVSVQTPASVTFTLTEPRNVLIRASAAMSARINGTVTGSAGGGVSVSGLPSDAWVSATSLYSVAPSASFNAPIQAQKTWALPAGTYTLTTWVSFTGSLGSGPDVRITLPDLYVQILERA